MDWYESCLLRFICTFVSSSVRGSSSWLVGLATLIEDSDTSRHEQKQSSARFTNPEGIDDDDIEVVSQIKKDGKPG